MAFFGFPFKKIGSDTMSKLEATWILYCHCRCRCKYSSRKAKFRDFQWFWATTTMRKARHWPKGVFICIRSDGRTILKLLSITLYVKKRDLGSRISTGFFKYGVSPS